MMNLSLALNKGLNLAPRKQSWIEAAGYVLIGLGLLVGLAAYSYSPGDYVQGRLQLRDIHNAAGPVGAYLAREVLGRFGVIGLLWPVAFAVWGLGVVLGFMVFPTAKRVLGFLGMTVILATFADIQLFHMGFSEPHFGYGGSVGRKIALPLEAYLNYAGSLIALAVAALVNLVLTGNIMVSRTASRLQDGRYHMARGSRKALKLLKDFKAKEDARLAAIRQLQKAPAALQAGSSHQTERPAALQQKESLKEDARPKAAKEKSRDVTIDVEATSKAEASEDLDFYFSGPAFDLPGAGIFQRSQRGPKHDQNFRKIMAEKLTAQLQEFKVEGKVTNVIEGPVVTTFEFEPAAGTKVSKITNLAEDLARLLQARSLRILAPIPGKQVLGFEVPNDESRMIGFGDLIAHPDFNSRKYQLPIAMGLDTNGKPLIADLAAMPHLLVAGSTGSGKSVFMNSLIASLISRHQAKDLRLIMIDPKMVEMAAYNGIPHMACPVITDPEGDARAKLKALVKEMDHRYELMQALGAKNITSFNQTIRSKRKADFSKFDGRWATLPYIVLIIDELADMMMVLGKDAETPITRLAQKARAAGIHLVIATQRPSADVVTGLIKANFPTRVAFRVLSGVDSRTILDQSGAETLLGKGDMLFLSEKGLQRLHGAYLSDDEVMKMVKCCKRRK